MKKYKQLTSQQRYAIDLGLKNKTSMRKIAESIGVSTSTISRELKRNKNKRGGYSWRLAQEISQERKERLPGNRAISESTKNKVLKFLKQEWSPKQISGYLNKTEQIKISHETIYKWIREDKKNGGKLYLHCRHKLKHRKRPLGSVKNIPNRKSIHQRAKEADGTRFGDFEMDTIIGAKQTEMMVTITERKTNFVLIQKLAQGWDAKEVSKTVIAMLLPYKEKIKTITTDNGTEFTAHEMISKQLNAPVYFADPYASWQKGSIENANKLIRQYVPKRISFKKYSHQQIKKIQYKLNKRPREKLKFSSPKIEFYKYFL